MLPNSLERCILPTGILRCGPSSASDRWRLQANHFPGACLSARFCRRSVAEYVQIASGLPPASSNPCLALDGRWATDRSISNEYPHSERAESVTALSATPARPLVVALLN